MCMGKNERRKRARGEGREVRVREGREVRVRGGREVRPEELLSLVVSGVFVLVPFLSFFFHPSQSSFSDQVPSLPSIFVLLPRFLNLELPGF